VTLRIQQKKKETRELNELAND